MIKIIDLESVLLVRKEVMWPKENIEFVSIKGDEKAIHFGYWKDSLWVGTVSVFEDNGSLQFRKLAVFEKYQGNGIGTKLVEHVKSYAISISTLSLWCNARIEKLGFYKRLGFTPKGEVFHKNDKYYQMMVMKF